MSENSTASESRARVRAAVENSAEPVTVETLVAQTGLHANTVRGHLDVLLARGVIEREAADSHGRGRPRWLYRASSPMVSPYQHLAEALTVQLAQMGDPGIAQSAAEQWARALPDLPHADTPDEAVAEATAALRRLGFHAEANALGNEIAITECPYAQMVDENPVICDIHTALVARLLGQTGQPVTIESMDVWAREGMCLAFLRRPDLSPSWTVTADERGIITSKGRDIA